MVVKDEEIALIESCVFGVQSFTNKRSKKVRVPTLRSHAKICPTSERLQKVRKSNELV